MANFKDNLTEVYIDRLRAQMKRKEENEIKNKQEEAAQNAKKKGK